VLGGVAALVWTWKRKREHKPVIPTAKEKSTTNNKKPQRVA
jgi:hypothetical protein